MNKIQTFKNREIYFVDKSNAINDIEEGFLQNFITVFYEVAKDGISEDLILALFNLSSRYYVSVGDKTIEDMIDSTFISAELVNQIPEELSMTVSFDGNDKEEAMFFILNCTHTDNIGDTPIVFISTEEYKSEVTELVNQQNSS